MYGDLVIPTMVSKSSLSYGAGAQRGTRAVEVSKAMPAPVTPQGPVKKAPTLARTGPKIGKGMLLPKPPPGVLSSVAKFVSAEERKALAKKPRKKGGFVLKDGSFPIPDERHIGIAESMKHNASPAKQKQVDAEIAQAKKYFGKGFGDYKTIEQRERERRGAHRHKVGGVGDAALGGAGLVMLSSVDQMRKVAGLKTSTEEAKHIRSPLVHGHDRQWAMQHKGGGMSLGSLPVKARLSLAARRARKMPHGATRLGAQGLIGVGAARYVVGRSQEAYQDTRLRAKRIENRQRAVAKAYRSYDPEERRQRRLGAAAAGSGLSGGALVVAGGRRIASDTERVGNWKMRALVRHPLKDAKHGKERAKPFSELAFKDAKHAVLVKPSRAAMVGTGAALLAGSGRLMSHRDQGRWQ